MTCCHPPSRRQRRRARFTDNIFLLAVSPPFFPVTVEVLIDLPRHRKPVQHQQRPVTEAIERALFPVTEAIERALLDSLCLLLRESTTATSTGLAYHRYIMAIG